MDLLWRFIKPTRELAAVKPELNEIINLQLPTLWEWQEVYYNFHKQQAEGGKQAEAGTCPEIWERADRNASNWASHLKTAEEGRSENWWAEMKLYWERNKPFDNAGDIKVRYSEAEEDKIRGTAM